MRKVVLGTLLVLALALTASAQRGDSIRLFANGFTDDTEALQAWNDGAIVWDRKFRKQYGNVLQNETFLIDGRILRFDNRKKTIRNCTFIVKYPNRYSLAFTSFWRIRHYGNTYLVEDRFGRYRRVRIL